MFLTQHSDLCSFWLCSLVWGIFCTRACVHTHRKCLYMSGGPFSCQSSWGGKGCYWHGEWRSGFLLNLVQSGILVVHLFQLVNKYGYIINSAHRSLGFTVCVTQFLCFGKCIVTCTHHYNIIQNSFRCSNFHVPDGIMLECSSALASFTQDHFTGSFTLLCVH